MMKIFVTIASADAQECELHDLVAREFKASSDRQRAFMFGRLCSLLVENGIVTVGDIGGALDIGFLETKEQHESYSESVLKLLYRGHNPSSNQSIKNAWFDESDHVLNGNRDKDE